MKRDQEDLCMAFYSSRLRHVYASPISSLRWAPGSAGQSALFAYTHPDHHVLGAPTSAIFLALLIPPSWNRVGLFGGYNLPGSVDIRGVDFQSRTGINLNKGRYVGRYLSLSLSLGMHLVLKVPVHDRRSLWCAEWKPQASHVALGVTQGAMLFDVTTSRVLAPLSTPTLRYTP
jgi:hypothetical protein